MGKKTIFKIEQTEDYTTIERIDEDKDGNLSNSTILFDNNSFNIEIQKSPTEKNKNYLNLNGEVILKKAKFDC